MRKKKDRPVDEDLMRRGAKLKASGIFLGGTIDTLDSHGRGQFIHLLQQGLCPSSRLLDMGCGSLRGAYWTVRFLGEGAYHGIEPNEKWCKAGQRELLGDKLMLEKNPKFHYVDDFDPGPDAGQFDMFMACSIWTHAPKPMIGTMLDRFEEYGAPGAKMLASFKRATGAGDDYKGSNWVGKSHQSRKAGVIRHDLIALRVMGRDRGLVITDLQPHKESISWLLIERA